jgi:hypothetical protein
LAASSPPIFIAGEASVSVFGVSMMVVTSVWTHKNQDFYI